MKKQSGFTLIELLLVLAIIGIISAIAIPALLGQRARARDTSVRANTQSMITDLVGAYDAQRDGAAAITTASITAAIPQFATALNPWNNQLKAYTAGTAGTVPVPVGTVIGNVVVDYRAAAANAPGALGATGLLNSPVNGSATFAASVGID